MRRAKVAPGHSGDTRFVQQPLRERIAVATMLTNIGINLKGTVGREGYAQS